MATESIMTKRAEKDVGGELACEVASLSPALRTIFQRCGHPTPENLARLVAEVPEDERGHCTVAMAAETLLGIIDRQAALQRHRRRRQERERAYLVGLLAFEEFPMPRPRPPT